MVQADVGVATAMELVENVRRIVKERRIEDAAGIKPVLKEQIRELLGTGNMTINVYWQSPTVVLVVGVNGVGITTTIGKMAHLYKMDGKKSTFRCCGYIPAAAIDHWKSGERVNVDLTSTGKVPTCRSSYIPCRRQRRGGGLLIIDTAAAGCIHKATLWKS